VGNVTNLHSEPRAYRSHVVPVLRLVADCGGHCRKLKRGWSFVDNLGWGSQSKEEEQSCEKKEQGELQLQESKQPRPETRYSYYLECGSALVYEIV
jgi:hypothetical protein